VLTVVVGLTSSLVFGTADFLGGLSTKRLGAVLATGIAASVGIVVFLLLALAIPGTWSWEAVGYGALSGVLGAIAIGLLYACLAIGPMSILSPLTAVISAIVPVTWGLIQGERLSLLGYLALGIALVAVVLVGFVPEKGAVRPSLRGVAYAVVSGTLIGILLVLLNQAPDDSGLLPLVFNRASYLVILWAIVLVVVLRARARRDPPARIRPVLPLIIAAGVADATANTLIIVGLRLGDLSVIAVLTALYPAGTIALAAIVLKERIAPVQWVGLVLALIAAAMLALA